MGEPQGLDELPCDREEVDDDYYEETEDEAAARLQQEKCDSCRQQAEQFGETVDCDMCGVIEDELGAAMPVAIQEKGPEDYDAPIPDDEIPF